MQVFLDTNFLLIPFQYNVDIFTEIDRLLPSPTLLIADLTLVELDRVLRNPESSGKDKDAVRMAKQLIKRKHLKKIVVSDYNTIDDFLVDNAEEFAYVATQDKELKKKLKNQTGFIVLRRNHLELG